MDPTQLIFLATPEWCGENIASGMTSVVGQWMVIRDIKEQNKHGRFI